MRSFILNCRRNCHRADAWYVRALCAIPPRFRGFYVESARVEYDVTSFVRFTR